MVLVSCGLREGVVLCLEHEGRGKGGERGLGLRQRGAVDIARGGNACPVAQRLGEVLAAFQLRGGLRRAEYGNVGSAQGIGQAIDQRGFGPDHHEADGVLFAEGDNGGVVRGIQRHQLRTFGHAGVAGGSVEFTPTFGHGSGLRQLPAQGMFAATAAEDQDVHGTHSVLALSARRSKLAHRQEQARHDVRPDRRSPSRHERARILGHRDIERDQTRDRGRVFPYPHPWRGGPRQPSALGAYLS